MGYTALEEALAQYPSLKGACANAGYRKTIETLVRNVLKKTIEISGHITQGWAMLAKRWVVERTFAWLNNCRRLSKDDELAAVTAENMIMIAHSMLLLKRMGWINCEKRFLIFLEKSADMFHTFF